MSQASAVYKGRVFELEFKGTLGRRFSTAAARAQAIRDLAAPLHSIETKTSWRLILDTQDLDIYGAGFDLITLLNKKGIKQRFKSHGNPDRYGIMTRVEDTAILRAEKGFIIPALDMLGSKADKRNFIHINPADIRAIGVLICRSSYVHLRPEKDSDTIVEFKVDHVRAQPLFKGAQPLEINEIELDTESHDHELLAGVVTKMRGNGHKIDLVELSKVQQVLGAWAESIRKAKDSLERPHMNMLG